MDWFLLFRRAGERGVYGLRSKGVVCEMERRERETFVSPTEETIPLEDERALPPPRFDEKSVQRAQPAVPLERGARARSSWPPWVILLCVLGGVLGGVFGGLALTVYQRGAPRAESQAQAPRQTPVEVSDSAVVAPETAASSEPQGSKPADGQAASDATRAQETATQETTGAAREPGTKVDVEGARGGADAEGELRAALGGWLAATNSRDVGRQMSFYAPTVEAFYLARNASRESVRAEKTRLFARASAVNVEAAPPEIRVSTDGRAAVMRFRKRYRIDGEESRSGEVLQELRWRKTGGGWKIIGERDLRVLQ